MRIQWALPRVSIVLVIAVGALALAVNRGQIDMTSIEAAINDRGLWAPLGHVVLFALGTVLFLPGAIFGLAGGILFGPLWGTVVNLAGATLGSTAAFVLARYIVADSVRRNTTGRLERLMSGVDAEGWRFVPLVRLVPLFPFNVLNYARVWGPIRSHRRRA